VSLLPREELSFLLDGSLDREKARSREAVGKEPEEHSPSACVRGKGGALEKRASPMDCRQIVLITAAGLRGEKPLSSEAT